MIEEKNKVDVGDDHRLIRSESDDGSRVGVFAKGGCHLRALFACGPLIEPVLKGTCCIYHEGLVSDGRTDQQLQNLKGLPGEWIAPLVEKFRLGPDYFASSLFDSDFGVPKQDDLGRFPKNVIIFSTASDSVGRMLYRHKQHGFVFDPGAGWLRKVDAFVSPKDIVDWFRNNFEQVGMISVEGFVENLTKMIGHVRARTKAHFVAMNALTIAPGNMAHNYQSVKRSERVRWLEFHIALIELSRKLDFPILDLDRVVRRAGIRDINEPAHFPHHVNQLIAQEAFGIMGDCGVFR
jgi:hypothetical protein